MADAENATPLPGTMPDRLPESARPPEDFNPIAVAKELLRVTRAGALATIDRNTGHPFASLVNVATDSDGAPLILVSRPISVILLVLAAFSILYPVFKKSKMFRES